MLFFVSVNSFQILPAHPTLCSFSLSLLKREETNKTPQKHKNQNQQKANKTKRNKNAKNKPKFKMSTKTQLSLFFVDQLLPSIGSALKSG